MNFFKLLTVRNLVTAISNIWHSVIPYRCPSCERLFHFHSLNGLEICFDCHQESMAYQTEAVRQKRFKETEAVYGRPLTENEKQWLHDCEFF